MSSRTESEAKLAWAQIKANETGKPVYAVESTEPCAHGWKLSYKAPKKGSFKTFYPGGN